MCLNRDKKFLWSLGAPVKVYRAQSQRVMLYRLKTNLPEKVG